MASYYISLVDTTGSGGPYQVLVQRGGTAPVIGSGAVLQLPFIENNQATPVQSATFTGASNATPIVVTATNTFNNGDEVTVVGSVGNTGANGTFTVSSVSSSGFTLNNSVGNGSWTAGGVATKLVPTAPIYIAAMAGMRAVLNDKAAGN